MKDPAKARAGRIGGSRSKARGPANGRWLGVVDCTACASPAQYKSQALCRRCYDRIRNLGYAVGPMHPWHDWWVKLGRPSTCVIPSCGRKHKAVGLCGTHYSSEYRRGHPLWRTIAPKRHKTRPASGVWDATTVYDFARVERER